MGGALTRMVGRAAAGGGGPAAPAFFDDAFFYLWAEDLAGADGSDISGFVDHNGGTSWTDDNCKLQTNEVNGLNAVEVPAASIGLGGPAALLTGKTALTVMYVGVIDAVTTGPCFTSWGTSGDSNHYPYSDNNIYLCLGSNTRRNVGNYTTFGMNAWHTCVIRADSSGWDFRTNGVQRFNSGSNTFAVNTNPRFGNGALMRFSLLIGWDTWRNDTDVQDAESYAQSLYATP